MSNLACAVDFKASVFIKNNSFGAECVDRSRRGPRVALGVKNPAQWQGLVFGGLSF